MFPSISESSRYTVRSDRLSSAGKDVEEAIADIEEDACTEGGELEESGRCPIFEGVIGLVAVKDSFPGAGFNRTFRRRDEPPLVLLMLGLPAATERFVELKEMLSRSKYPGSCVSSLGKV
jgi:hypothetical protein